MESVWDLPIASTRPVAKQVVQVKIQQLITPLKQTTISKTMRFFDIAANLGSSQFAGIYKGKREHQSDLDEVIHRANIAGCDRLLLTGSNLKDSERCYQISQKNDKFYCTVGLHPSKSREAEKNPDSYFAQLDKLITNYKPQKCVAVGECGLDYDRLFCSPKDIQIDTFKRHFTLSDKHRLPIYLHSRNAREDFLSIIKENKTKYTNGLLHCYTGGQEELEEILGEGLYISLSGNSFKDSKTFGIIQRIPLDRIMIETDAPYCRVKPTDDGFSYLKSEQEVGVKQANFKKGCIVKGRNEPCFIKEISEMLAGVLKIDEQEISGQCYENSLKFFGLKDSHDQ